MQFTRLVLENYGVYGGRTDIDLRPEPGRPVILFGGRNGAGKTTLFESILVCLYGEGCLRMIRPPHAAAPAASSAPAATATIPTPAAAASGGRREYERLLASRLHRGSGGRGASKPAAVTVRLAAHVGGRGTEYEVRRSWGMSGEKMREGLSVGRRPLAGGGNGTGGGNGGAFEPVDMSSRWQSFITDLAPPAAAGLFFFDGERISAIARRYGGYAGDAFRSALGLDVVERLQADLVANAAREESAAVADDTGGKGGRGKRGAGARTKYAELEDEREKHERERARLADLLDRKGGEIAGLRAEVSAAEQRAESFRGGDSPDARLRQAGLELDDAARRVLAACADPAAALRLLPADMLSGAIDMLERAGTSGGGGGEEGASVLASVRRKVESDGTMAARARQHVIKILDAEAAARGYGRDCTGAAAEAGADAGGRGGSAALRAPAGGGEHAGRALRVLRSAAGRDDGAVVAHCRALASLRARVGELEASRDISDRGRSERQEAVRAVAALASRLGVAQSEASKLEAEMRSAARAARSANSRMREMLKTARRRGGSERKSELRARVLDALDVFHSRLRASRTRRLEDALLQNMRLLMHKAGAVGRVEVDAENGFAIRLYGGAGAGAYGAAAGVPAAAVDPASGLSEGERQVFALSVVWALAQVSGRPLPFVIDTPLARLDAEHRRAMTREFLPGCSHQVVVLSTDSEITRGEYARMEPHISRSYLLEFAGGSASCRPGYFWDTSGGGAGRK